MKIFEWYSYFVFKNLEHAVKRSLILVFRITFKLMHVYFLHSYIQRNATIRLFKIIDNIKYLSQIFSTCIIVA